MKKYIKLIKPILISPDSHCNPVSEDLESNWYYEEDADRLKRKYQHLNHLFSTVSFDVQYIECKMTNKEWLSTLTAEEWYEKIWWLLHDYGKSYTDSYQAILKWLDMEHQEGDTL